MLIGEAVLLEARLEFAGKHVCEKVLEAAVIGLEDGVLGGEIEWVATLQRVVH